MATTSPTQFSIIQQNYHHYEAHLPPPSLTPFSLRIPARALAPRSQQNQMKNFMLRNMGARPSPPRPSPRVHHHHHHHRHQEEPQAHQPTATSTSPKPPAKRRSTRSQNRVIKASQISEIVNSMKCRRGAKPRDANDHGSGNKQDKFEFTRPPLPPTFRSPRTAAFVRTADAGGFAPRPNSKLGPFYPPPPPPPHPNAHTPFPSHEASWAPRKVSVSSTSSLTSHPRTWSEASIFSTTGSSSERKDSSSSMQSGWTDLTELDTEMGNGGLDAKLQKEMEVDADTTTDLDTGDTAGSGVLRAEWMRQPMTRAVTIEEYVEELLIVYPNVGA